MHDLRSPLQLGSALVYLPERIISLVVYGISSIQLGHPLRKTFNRFKIGWWPELN